MKKTLLVVFVPLLLFSTLQAQKQKTVIAGVMERGSSHRVAASAMVPLAAFQRTHFAALGMNYSWSSHKFGPAGRIMRTALFFQGGGDYYAGKKLSTAGISFRYGGYLDIYAMAGVQYNGWERLHLSLAAGPVLSVYRGQADAGVGFQGGVDYYVNDKISIGPRIVYRGHKDVEGLYAVGVSAGYIF